MKQTRFTGKLNTTALAEAVATDLGISNSAAEDAVRAVFNTITRAVASGHDVAVTNFGTFRSVRAEQRTAYNPQTGGKVTVPAHQKLAFRASRRLRENVRRRRVATGGITKLPKGAAPARRGRS